MSQDQDAFDRGLFEGKVLAEIQTLYDYLNTRKRASEKLNVRLTKLELERSKLQGIILILGSVGGILGSAIITLLIKYLPTLLINLTPKH